MSAEIRRSTPSVSDLGSTDYASLVDRTGFCPGLMNTEHVDRHFVALRRATAYPRPLLDLVAGDAAPRRENNRRGRALRSDGRIVRPQRRGACVQAARRPRLRDCAGGR